MSSGGARSCLCAACSLSGPRHTLALWAAVFVHVVNFVSLVLAAALVARAASGLSRVRGHGSACRESDEEDQKLYFHLCERERLLSG